ncbi:alpha/beta hydrolase fold [Parafrankia sp. EAN1pec]|uniref:alpha/beta fold hydrolase n=1 Tax=Parafrankia sp. (strain EAN1pec) TaxID=298653 RepID=UPI00005422B2|nr:alpha/beta hydrolase fold [Frankia sp. EAN1pec]
MSATRVSAASALTNLAGRFRLPGIDLQADCYGDPGGVPVVFAHGGGQTRHAWGSAATAVARDGYWAISLDLRGHGESGWAEDGDYTFAVYARDLSLLAATLPNPPIFVGASVGGLAALLTVGEFGTAAKALVLVDVVPDPAVEGSERVLAFMRSGIDGFDNVEAVADAISEYLPERRRPTDLTGLRKNLRQHADGRLFWHWDPRLVAGNRLPSREDVARFYRASSAITVPALLLRGGRSDVVVNDGVQGLLDSNPLFELEEIADAGHMVAGDRNDRFTEALRRFLQRLDPDTARPVPRSQHP